MGKHNEKCEISVNRRTELYIKCVRWLLLENIHSTMLWRVFVVKTIRLAEKCLKSCVYGGKNENYEISVNRRTELYIKCVRWLLLGNLHFTKLWRVFVVKTIRLAEKCPQSWVYGEKKWKFCNFFQLPCRLVY